jgi:hypothetical protein
VEITRYPDAAEGDSIPSATAIAVRSPTGNNAISRNGDVARPDTERAQVHYAGPVIVMPGYSGFSNWPL